MPHGDQDDPTRHGHAQGAPLRLKWKRPRRRGRIVGALFFAKSQSVLTRRAMRCGSDGTAAVICSCARPAALPTNRPICDARVPRAIGQSLDWFVPTEAEVLGARVVDWPAAFPLAELKQRASASVVDWDVFSRRLRPPEGHHQHLMLGGDIQARTL